MRGSETESGSIFPMSVEGAGGLVFNEEGNLLLINHVNGSWVFPKGHVDPGEEHLQTAIREVEEEAGISTTCPNPEISFQTNYVNAHGQARSITWFVLHTKATEPVMREELFPEGRFMPVAEALELLSYPEDRRLLNQVLGHRGVQ